MGRVSDDKIRIMDDTRSSTKKLFTAALETQQTPMTRTESIPTP